MRSSLFAECATIEVVLLDEAPPLPRGGKRLVLPVYNTGTELMMKCTLFLSLVVGLAVLGVGCKKPAAPAASSNTQQPAVAQNASMPKVTKRVHAQFPKELWDKPGTVSVAVLIGTDGKVGQTKIVSSPHAELNQLAIDAVKQWEFEPAMKDGKPVASVATVGVNFQPPGAPANSAHSATK